MNDLHCSCIVEASNNQTNYHVTIYGSATSRFMGAALELGGNRLGVMIASNWTTVMRSFALLETARAHYIESDPDTREYQKIITHEDVIVPKAICRE